MGRVRRIPFRLRALALIAVLVWITYFVGIRTTSPPDHEPSLGVVAQVVGDHGTPGQDRPLGGCPACANGAQLMRFNPEAGLRVDMVVHVHPRVWSCGQADVRMVVSGTREFWEQHRLGPGVRTRIAVGWDGATSVQPPDGGGRAPLLAAFLADPQAPLHPAFYTDGDLAAAAPPAGRRAPLAPFPPGAPTGVRTEIADWAGPGREEDALHLHFRANWLHDRGFGSCYLSVPSLLANGAVAGTEHAIAALRRGPDTVQLERQAQPPSFGRVALASDGRFSEATPEPDDTEAVFVGQGGTQAHRALLQAGLGGGSLGPVWSCRPRDSLAYLEARAPRDHPADGSYAGYACGAVAVIDAHGVEDARAVFLIVAGVLIALAFEALARGETRVTRQRRRRGAR